MKVFPNTENISSQSKAPSDPPAGKNQLPEQTDEAALAHVKWERACERE